MVGVIAVGLGLMRDGSKNAVSAAYGVLIAVLSIGLLGAIIRRQGSWIGFTVFGLIHAAFSLGTVDNPHLLPDLPTIGFVDRIAEMITVRPTLRAALPYNIRLWDHGYMVSLDNDTIRSPIAEEQKLIDEFEAWKTAMSDFNDHAIPNAQRIGYMTVTLLVAVLGTIIGQLLERRQRSESPL